MRSPTSMRPLNAEKATSWVQKHLAITLAERQSEAIACAVREKIIVITGGPGTGKTTIINGLLMIFLRSRARVLLAAPTGRAAKRMTEATGFEAKTIHRLLEYSFKEGGFQRNDRNLLDCHVLIIDEASMIDTMLMHHLITAVPLGATVIFVGDVNQLPPVGAGNALKDIIASECVPVVELNEIFRQAKESRIIVNAHRIKQGLLPDLIPRGPELEDFYFVEKDDPDEVLKLIVELVKERIPRRFGFDPIFDIQVITPMNKGVVGVENLNLALQAALNPHGQELKRGSKVFRCDDKVMQITNNYEKEVFNGDTGRIIHIDHEAQGIMVSFEGNEVIYDHSDLDELVPAYAVTVHKSQGSEYPAVIIPLLTQHFILLQRNLVYTAVTRGRRLVVLLGSKRALSIGVKNDQTLKRYTSLALRLRSSALSGSDDEH
jgi:exodeoxyribonuclease V alpha subunit